MHLHTTRSWPLAAPNTIVIAATDMQKATFKSGRGNRTHLSAFTARRRRRQQRLRQRQRQRQRSSVKCTKMLIKD